MKITPVTYREAARGKNIFLSAFSKENLQKEEFFSYLGAAAKHALIRIAKKDFSGDDDTETLRFFSGRNERVVLFGWGSKEKWNYRKTPLVARRYARYAKVERIPEFSTSLYQA